ncbi:MAG: TonB-dependent receptor [Bacteroidota bacterium]|nr:TonB-dependent receptor [Bacteroidota bacterium]
MFKYLLVVIFMATVAMCTAQDCKNTLKGKITDFHNNKPLELAQVYVEEQERTYTSNSAGEYQVNDLCTGVYHLIVTHIDCDKKSIEVLVNQDKILNITLEHHINELDEVQIVADVHDDHATTQNATRIDKELIQKYSGATLGDALETVPGVSSLKTGQGVVKPIVHGLYGSRITIVNNGVRLQDQEWGTEHAPNIDPNTASSIRVIKGSSALRYGGDAVGGTIIIDPARVISKDTLMGNAILTGQSNGRGGAITAGIQRYKKSGWYQQANITFKRLGDFEAPDYILSNTGSQTAATRLAVGYKQFEYGLSAEYNFYDTELGILRASHIGNTADLVRSINSGQPAIINEFTYDIDVPKQEVIHHQVALNAFKRFRNLGKFEFNYQYQLNNRKEFDVRRGALSERAALDIDLKTHNFQGYLNIDASDKWNHELGVDAVLQTNSPDATTGVRRLIPDYNSIKVGGFLGTQYQFTDRLTIEAGARYDHYSIDAKKFYITSRWESLGYDVRFAQFERFRESIQVYTEPELDFDLFAFSSGVQYSFKDHFDITFNVSHSQRAPNPGELFSEGLHHALATIEIGRLELNKEVSNKISASFHANYNNWDVELAPYYNRINDFIQLVPNGVQLTNRGAFAVYEYEQLDAVLAGVDISASYHIKRKETIKRTPYNRTINLTKNWISLGAQFSYVYGEDVKNDKPLIDIPPAQLLTKIEIEDVFTEGLQVEIANQQVWKQDRFPDNDYEITYAADNGNAVTETVEISESPDAYNLWNLGLAYSIKSQNNKPNLSFRLQVNNVLSTKYRDYLNRQRFYADEIGRNFIAQILYNF